MAPRFFVFSSCRIPWKENETYPQYMTAWVSREGCLDCTVVHVRTPIRVVVEPFGDGQRRRWKLHHPLTLRDFGVSAHASVMFPAAVSLMRCCFSCYGPLPACTLCTPIKATKATPYGGGTSRGRGHAA